jgi:hypothetical protein
MFHELMSRTPASTPPKSKDSFRIRVRNTQLRNYATQMLKKQPRLVDRSPVRDIAVTWGLAQAFPTHEKWVPFDKSEGSVKDKLLRVPHLSAFLAERWETRISTSARHSLLK